jgi:phosphate transport system permease protein
LTDLSIPSSGRLSPGDLAGDPRRQRSEAAARIVFLGAAVTSVAITAAIIWSLARETWTFMTNVVWSSVWGEGWFPRAGEFDIRTLIVGSLIVTAVAMFVAAPLGLGAAVYLSEYASPRVRKLLKPALEILAGIPSVVLGFFALTFIAPELVQRIFDSSPQANLLVAGLGVGILTIPLVASVSEDALQSVPSSLREASYGVGARKVSTVTRVVIPAAVSGLVAAGIIAVSRALGETMVVFIAAGGGNGAFFTTNPLDKGLTMTAAMATQAAGTDNVAGVGLSFQSLFFVGTLLFLITLTLNLIADRFVRRVRQKY